MDYLTLLEQGIDRWNQWRASHPTAACSLEGKDLSHGYLFEGNFQGVNLRGANLQRACLVGANFQNADLTGVDFSGAYLGDANFYGANLANANFKKAAIERADMRQANLLGTQLAEVDLRSVKLPDPALHPYSHQTASLLSSRPKTQQQPVPSRQATIAKAKSLKAKHMADKRSSSRRMADKSSLINRITTPLKPRSRETSQEMADRQQSIRLSAIPARQVNVSASSNRTRPLKSGNQSFSSQSAGTSRSLRQKLTRQAPQSSPPADSQMQWGRRQDDQRLAALLGHSVRQKQNWVPAIAAAGIAVAVGLPFAIPTIVNSQQQVAAESVTTLALTKSLTGTSQIQAIATHTSEDGNTQVIAGESNGNIEIWDGQTGATLQTLTGYGEGIASVAMSISGQWLVSSSRTGLTVWNPKTGERVHMLPTQSETTGALAIAPDERTFISSDKDGNIAAWDMVSGQQRYYVNSGDAVWDVAIAPDGQSFVSTSGNSIRQWNIATGKVLQAFTGHSDIVRSVAISPDGTTLVSGSQDQTINLWNLATGELQTTLSGHTDQIASLAISGDGTTLASSSSDRTLKLWDLPSRQLTKTLDQNTDTVVAVAFAPSNSVNGHTLISGGSNQTINVWQ